MPPAFVTYLIPFGIPLISTLVSIPLVAQKMPPNYWYGFRTRKTLSDPAIWYRANYLGGLNLLYAGIVALCINGILAVLIEKTVFILTGSAITMLTTVIAMAISMAQVRDL